MNCAVFKMPLPGKSCTDVGTPSEAKEERFAVYLDQKFASSMRKTCLTTSFVGTGSSWRSLVAFALKVWSTSRWNLSTPAIDNSILSLKPVAKSWFFQYLGISPLTCNWTISSCRLLHPKPVAPSVSLGMARNALDTSSVPYFLLCMGGSWSSCNGSWEKCFKIVQSMLLHFETKRKRYGRLIKQMVARKYGKRCIHHGLSVL
mmetsp:Transcript_69061/g.174064  ORF Transcript_69061/g.174064 Transcript_69061/m.174064 type:complete len:203 (+) Transcript_69061:628-1236(+)